MRIVVLLSGSGSNLQAIIDAAQADKIKGEITAVISNRPDVKGLERASNHGIENTVVDHKNYNDRETFEEALKTTIDQYKPDLIVLAGFMRILNPSFVNHYLGRMINIHPSLLPKYPGLNTHQRAIDAGDTSHGATVHFVTAELDGGPAIVHAKVSIEPGDDAGKLAARVLTQEHIIYPIAVSLFTEGRLVFENNKASLDGHPLPTTGKQYSE